MPRGKPEPFFRVDPRLVHSTLMNAWVPARRAGWLLLADSQLVADPRRRHIYQMSAGDVVRIHFCAEAGAASVLASLPEEGPGIVLFSTLGGVLRAMRSGLEIDLLNVGHVPEGPGRSELHPAVHLGSGDVEMIRQIESAGVEVRIQPLPDDAPIPVVSPAAAAAPSRPTPPSRFSQAPPPRDAEALTGSRSRGESTAAAERAEQVLEVVNERGLHLRAAHVLAALCTELPVRVKVGRDDEMVNAKSLLGLTTLGAARGSRLTVLVEGDGALEAMDRIRALFEAGFNEGSGGEA